jgi:dynein heavy chain
MFLKYIGRYVVTYVAKYPGKYEVKVDFLGTFGGVVGPVRGSGVFIDFEASAPKENNLMTGNLVINALKADILNLKNLTDELTSAVFVRVKDDSW